LSWATARTALAQDLDRDVAGDPVLLDQAPREVELDLGGRGEPDLDLLEANPHEQLKELDLLLDAHRLGEGLVAVAKVDAAPDRGAAERPAGPLAAGEVDGREGRVLGDGIGLHGDGRSEIVGFGTGVQRRLGPRAAAKGGTRTTHDPPLRGVH